MIAGNYVLEYSSYSFSELTLQAGDSEESITMPFMSLCPLKVVLTDHFLQC